MEEEVSYRMSQRKRMMIDFGCLLRSRSSSIVAKVRVMEGLVSPSVLCSSDSLAENKKERR